MIYTVNLLQSFSALVPSLSSDLNPLGSANLSVVNSTLPAGNGD